MIGGLAPPAHYPALLCICSTYNDTDYLDISKPSNYFCHPPPFSSHGYTDELTCHPATTRLIYKRIRKRDRGKEIAKEKYRYILQRRGTGISSL